MGLHSSSVYSLPTLKKKVVDGKEVTVEEGFPLTHSLFNISNLNENMLMWLFLLNLTKSPEGMKILGDMAKGLIDAFGKSLNAYCRAGTGNRVAAWGSGRLLSLLMERFGVITQMQATDFSIGINIITGASVAEGFIDTLQGIFPFTSPEPSEYPTTVHLGNDETK